MMMTWYILGVERVGDQGPRGVVQNVPYVVRGPLENVAHATQVVEQRVELHLVPRHAAAQWLQQCQHLLSRHSNCPQQDSRQHVNFWDVCSNGLSLEPRHVEPSEY